MDRDLVPGLLQLIETKDRATLAALRRGLGKPAGSAGEMYSFVIPRLPDRQHEHAPWTWDEQCCFIVAALFAWQPGKRGTQPLRDFGASARVLKQKFEGSDGPERRFVALLNANREDLPQHLRSMVGLLDAHDVDINWQVLFNDLKRWSAPNRHVQAAWARSFWRGASAESAPAEASEEAEAAAE